MGKLGTTSYKQTKFGILPRDKVIELEAQGTKKGLQKLSKATFADTENTVWF